MTHENFTWEQHGTTLYGEYWKVENAKANIVVAHGMGEHLGRYAIYVIPQLIAAGFSVLAFDHFGHGKTKGKRGNCPNYDAVLDSIDTAIAKSSEFLGENPTFLYGHSMGGNASCNYVLRRKNQLKGLVLSSPMLRIAFDPPAWKMMAGKIMRNIYPAFTEKTGLEADAISRDKDQVEMYLADPLIHDKISVNFSLPFFEAGDWAIENADKLKTPTFLLHGTGDRLTSHVATTEFADKAGDLATLSMIKDAYHEIHTESAVKEDFMQSIITWINKQL